MVNLPFDSAHQRQVALWVLRGLAPGLGRKAFLPKNGYADDDLARFLGLDEVPIAKAPRVLDAMLKALETSSEEVGLTAQTRENFSRFAWLLRLSAVERQVLEFVVLMSVECSLRDLCIVAVRALSFDVAGFFAGVLRLDMVAVRRALAADGRLRANGLLARSGTVRGIPQFFSRRLAEQLVTEPFDAARILGEFGTTPAPAELGLADFPHLRGQLDLLVPYLRKSFARRSKGVNILFHGPPGTGKSQLARVLAAALRRQAFELATADTLGNPLKPRARLGALATSQAMFRTTRMLFVFDEAEDIFASGSRLLGSLAQSRKGWINQFLETCSAPVIWISNSIDELDPAFARRFDFIVEVPVPPRAQRQKIIAHTAGNILSAPLIERLAHAEHLAPAVVTRTCMVLERLGNELPAEQRDAAFLRLVSNTMRAQGNPDPARAPISPLPADVYDVSHLNTTTDLVQIANCLRENPSARICLFGPPGTGKTSFGHWLARELGQPLHAHKASDLLSQYVGMTEKRIAKAFERATDAGAVLLLDEIDSFLQERGSAQRTWEVTQVNEMLTQMEAFPGIMIASTNLIERLDSASLRRFDIKIHFDFLRPDQVVRLLVSHCEALKLPAPTQDDLARATTLNSAAPGDFAAVARRHRFQPFPNPAGFLNALTEELGHKDIHHRRIGF